jgi:hypothetical protein
MKRPTRFQCGEGKLPVAVRSNRDYYAAALPLGDDETPVCLG